MHIQIQHDEIYQNEVKSEWPVTELGPFQKKKKTKRHTNCLLLSYIVVSIIIINFSILFVSQHIVSYQIWLLIFKFQFTNNSTRLVTLHYCWITWRISESRTDINRERERQRLKLPASIISKEEWGGGSAFFVKNNT